MTIFQKLNIECNDELNFNTEIQKIFGMGVKNNLYKKYGLTKSSLFGFILLKPNFEYRIESYLLKTRKISFPLRQQISENIRKKISKKTYQGLRHEIGLSVHGQRTHSNSNTNRRKFMKSLNIIGDKFNKKKFVKNLKPKRQKAPKEKKLKKK